MSDVTHILSQIERGDRRASEQLLPLVYEELRKLAAAKIAQEKPGQTLQATALVHEAYVRLVGGSRAEGMGLEGQNWNSRGHFFGAAAEAMRRILVEQARRKQALAEEQRDKVAGLHESLRQQEQRQRRLLYGARMSLIKNAWEADNTDRVRELLNATRPRPGEEDLRGFEWHYWQRQMHAEQRTIDSPFPLLMPSVLSMDQSRAQSDTARFSADNKYIATAAENFGATLVRVWEIESGKELLEKRLDQNPPLARRGGPLVTELCHADAERVALVIRATVVPVTGQQMVAARLQVFNVATGETAFSKEIEYDSSRAKPKTFVVSRNGSRIAALLREPVVQIWDGRTGEEVAQVPIPPREGAKRLDADIALSPDGSKLAVKPVGLGGSGETLGITVTGIGSDFAFTTPPFLTGHFEFSGDGSRLLALSSDDPQRVVGRQFDAATGEESSFSDARLVGGRFVNLADVAISVVRFSPDSCHFAYVGTAGTNNKLVLCSAATAQIVQEFKGHPTPIVHFAFGSDGERLNNDRHTASGIARTPKPRPDDSV